MEGAPVRAGAWLSTGGPEAAPDAVHVRKLAWADIPAVLALQEASPGAARWPRGDYERISRTGDTSTPARSCDLNCWVAVQAQQVKGFLVARHVADELTILNMAVSPDRRRCGIGSQMLEVAVAWGRASGARMAFLEVRESNAEASAFYARQGFAPSGRRKGFYTDPPEDALLLSRQLT